MTLPLTQPSPRRRRTREGRTVRENGGFPAASTTVATLAAFEVAFLGRRSDRSAVHDLAAAELGLQRSIVPPADRIHRAHEAVGGGVRSGARWFRGSRRRTRL